MKKISIPVTLGFMLCHASLTYSQNPAMNKLTTTAAQEEDYKRFLSCKRAVENGNIAPLAAYAKRGGDLNARSQKD